MSQSKGNGPPESPSSSGNTQAAAASASSPGTSKNFFDAVCNLCKKVILTKRSLTGRRFGILNKCDHTFCMPCLQTRIRANILQSLRSPGCEADDAIDSSLICPVCKKYSTIVMSSSILFTSFEEKVSFEVQFKRSMLNVKCPFLKRGIPICYCHPKHSRVTM